MAAFSFSKRTLPGVALQFRQFIAGLFNTSTGHDHDGTNSKAIASQTSLTLVNPVLTNAYGTVRRAYSEMAGDGAITIASGIVRLTKGSAAAVSLAAPAAAEQGTTITIMAGSAFAHVITFTGNILDDGTNATKLKATTAAYVGSNVTVTALNARWVLVSNVAATIAAS